MLPSKTSNAIDRLHIAESLVKLVLQNPLWAIDKGLDCLESLGSTTGASTCQTFQCQTVITIYNCTVMLTKTWGNN